YIEVGETATYSYTGRSDADGYVSRGFALGEKAFAIPADQLNFNNNSEFSITFWMYLNSINHGEDGTQLLNVRSSADSYPAGDWGYIWSQLVPEGKTDDDGNSYHLNNLMFHYRLSSNAGVPVQVSQDFVFKPQTWYHVAMVIGSSGSNKTLTLYINGKLVGSGTSSGSLYGWKSSNAIMIGGRASKRAGIDGTIDEVRLYKKTLNSSEVKESMKHANYVSDANFIGYWDFENEAASDNSMASTGYNKSLKAYKYDPQSITDSKYAVEQVSYAAGAPFISGNNYKIETLPIWSLKRASIISSSGNKDAGMAKAIYSSEGDYTATLTLANGWGSDTKTIEVVEVKPTGIEDNVSVEDMMQAFPNPFENEVYVNFTEDGVYTVELYGNAGRMLNKALLNATAGEVYPIAVDGEAGIYFIKIKGEGGLLKVMKVAKK
ncbi:MAG: T9SS type A sorting domain-containing protein, partial [Odoribacter sp.]|nr:T9SS type A sorting domain-containing protein [Odoribacter sp.]